MLRRRLERGSAEPTVNQVVDAHDLVAMRESVEQVTVHDDVLAYVVSLANATRQHPQVAVGASPRAELDLVQHARARALLLGRDYVIPEDVKSLAVPTMAHRISLKPEMWVRRVHGADVVEELSAAAAGAAGPRVIETRRTEAELRWHASPLTRAVATCAGVVLAAALIGSRWQLIAFVAPLLGVLCSIGWQRTVPKVCVHAEPGLQRCFEGRAGAGERVGDRRTGRRRGHARADRCGRDATRRCARRAPGRQTVTVAADRWGRYPIRATVDVVAPGGLLSGTATVDASDVFVFPVAPPQSTADPEDRTARPARHPPDPAHRARRRIRRHPAVRPRRPAANGQLAGQRPPRQPARHRAADRPGRRCGGADRHVRAAAGPGDRGDRAGAARRGPGGAERTAQRRPGRDRHARRRSAALARRRHRPAPVLPGARHDARCGRRIRNHDRHIGAARRPAAGRDRRRVLHHARHRVRAVADRPAQAWAHRRRRRRARGRARSKAERNDPLFTRMWAMQRSFMYRDMGTVGVDIVSWPSENTLDQSMRLVPEHRRPVRGRR